jgi:hypothetical protein
MRLKLLFLKYWVKFNRFILKIQGKYIEVNPNPKYDAQIIQNRMDYVANHGGGTVHCNAGVYNINQTIVLKSNVKLEGEKS